MIIRTALAMVALLLPFLMVKYATALLIGFLIFSCGNESR